MIDPGAPPLGRHPDGFGQPFGDRLQFGPSGLDGGDDLVAGRIDLLLGARSQSETEPP